MPSRYLYNLERKLKDNVSNNNNSNSSNNNSNSSSNSKTLSSPPVSSLIISNKNYNNKYNNNLQYSINKEDKEFIFKFLKQYSKVNVMNTSMLRSISIIPNSVVTSTTTTIAVPAAVPTTVPSTALFGTTTNNSIQEMQREASTISTILLSDLIALSIRTNLPLTFIKREYKRFQRTRKIRTRKNATRIGDKIINAQHSRLSTVQEDEGGEVGEGDQGNNSHENSYYHQEGNVDKKINHVSNKDVDTSTNQVSGGNGNENENEQTETEIKIDQQPQKQQLNSMTNNKKDNETKNLTSSTNSSNNSNSNNSNSNTSNIQLQPQPQLQKRPSIIPTSCLSGNAQGLPNYGQTCFFNAVLQALASITPFIRYLERIVYVHYHETQQRHLHYLLFKQQQQTQQHQKIQQKDKQKHNTRTSTEFNNNNDDDQLSMSSSLSSFESAASTSSLSSWNNVTSFISSASNSLLSSFSLSTVATNSSTNSVGTVTPSLLSATQIAEANANANTQNSASSTILLSQLLLSILQYINCSTSTKSYSSASTSMHMSTSTSNSASKSTPATIPSMNIHEKMKLILNKIALENNQFKQKNTSLNEQQDAQELLLSLISIVIEEANLDKDEEEQKERKEKDNHASHGTQFNNDDDDDDDNTNNNNCNSNDGILVKKNEIGASQTSDNIHYSNVGSSSLFSLDDLYNEDDNIHNDIVHNDNRRKIGNDHQCNREHDDAVDNVEQKRETEIKNVKEVEDKNDSPPHDIDHDHDNNKEDGNKGILILNGICDDSDTTKENDDINSSSSSNSSFVTTMSSQTNSNDGSSTGSSQKEEKKEERDDAKMNKKQQQQQQRQNGISNEKKKKETTSTASKQPKSKLSTSMQMMIQNISNKTPSPLSGCIGSTLQCCACKHVRSTKETPFLEIPIVPTSISNAYASFHSVNGLSSSPTSNNGTSSVSSFPSCTLHQCLADFTSIERVHEVDCHACTIKEELSQLDEEASILRNAIGSLLTKKKRITKNKDSGNGNNQDQEALVLLRRDLDIMEERIRFLSCTDLDAEEDDKVDSDASLEDEIDDYLFKDIGAFGNNNNDDSMFLDITKNKSQHRRKLPKPRRVDANKRLLLTRLPPVLCLHVKRLYFDPLTGRMAKSMQHIDFSEYLDLTSLCAENVVVGGYQKGEEFRNGHGKGRGGNYNDNANAMNSASQNGKGCDILPYRLMSVIEHRGNAHAGHYLTYRRVSDNSPSTAMPIGSKVNDSGNRANTWVVVSDEKVAFIGWENVRRCEAYMLMYEAM